MRCTQARRTRTEPHERGHTGPPDGAFFGINMWVNTPGAITYSSEDISEDLEAASTRHDLASP